MMGLMHDDNDTGGKDDLKRVRGLMHDDDDDDAGVKDELKRVWGLVHDDDTDVSKDEGSDA